MPCSLQVIPKLDADFLEMDSVAGNYLLIAVRSP
jgi:hypothetical protein